MGGYGFFQRRYLSTGPPRLRETRGAINNQRKIERRRLSRRRMILLSGIRPMLILLKIMEYNQMRQTWKSREDHET